MWWVTSGAGSSLPAGEQLEHRVDVLDHVGVAGAQGQRLDPDDPHVQLDALGVDAGRRDRARLARQPAGELERVGVADRVDGAVDAAPSVASLTAARGSSSVRWTGVGAERLGHLEPLGDGVDRDHLRRRRRPSRPGPRRGRPGRAEHRDRAAGLEVERVDRVVAGPHHVAGEQRDVVAHPLREPGAGSGRRAGPAPARPGRPAASRAPRRGRRRAPRRTCGSRRGGRRSTRRRPCSSSRARGRRRRRGSTPSPAAVTVPTYSWPIVKPGSIWTRPW